MFCLSARMALDLDIEFNMDPADQNEIDFVIDSPRDNVDDLVDLLRHNSEFSDRGANGCENISTESFSAPATFTDEQESQALGAKDSSQDFNSEEKGIDAEMSNNDKIDLTQSGYNSVIQNTENSNAVQLDTQITSPDNVNETSNGEDVNNHYTFGDSSVPTLVNKDPVEEKINTELSTGIEQKTSLAESIAVRFVLFCLVLFKHTLFVQI